MSTGQPDPYPRLLADIGGTNARFGLETAPGVIEDVDVLQGDAYPTFEEAVRAYLAGTGAKRVAHAAFGIATPVTGDVVSMTNRSWGFSVSGLKAALGLSTLLVLNDFTALAWSLPHLAAHEKVLLGGGEADPSAPIALLGAGTGLGVSGLVPSAAGPVPLAGEGGHVSFSPVDDRELMIWQFARKSFGHVSAERFLSGAGLELIHAALADRDRAPVHLRAPAIVDGAASGDDPRSVEAVEVFAGMLGTAAANLALTLGARGGVYIGGGIVPRIGAALFAAPFRRRFEDHGRFSGYLAAIPAYLIDSRYPALTGMRVALSHHLGEM